MIQNDARISRIKDESSSLERLQDVLREEFSKLCKGDKQMMRYDAGVVLSLNQCEILT